MVQFTDHYSCAQSPQVLFGKAEYASERIKEICEERKAIPFYCYTGMSGIALYTALSYFHDYNSVYAGCYVRKPGEKSHGKELQLFTNRIGFRSPTNALRGRSFHVFFIDDLISTGETVKRTINTVMENNGGFNLHRKMSLRENISDGFFTAVLFDGCHPELVGMQKIQFKDMEK